MKKIHADTDNAGGTTAADMTRLKMRQGRNIVRGVPPRWAGDKCSYSIILGSKYMQCYYNIARMNVPIITFASNEKSR